MFYIYIPTNRKLLCLITWILFNALSLKAQEENKDDFSAEKVNLALRRTADGLLRLAGDSTSRIPAVEQAGPDVWRVQLHQPFRYEQLPAMLQSSLDVFGIKRPYEVSIRDCADAKINLGYHQTDFLQNNTIPCAGREMPEGCHYIEISFLNKSPNQSFLGKNAGYLLMMLVSFVGLLLILRKKPIVVDETRDSNTEWLEFGNSRLDVAGQILDCNGKPQSLTFREAKLLKLFATSPDKLLERDVILREVWADEGVLVGRSVDVFVSRLRKKLAADPTVGLVAVHGVGYRLETGKVGVG